MIQTVITFGLLKHSFHPKNQESLFIVCCTKVQGSDILPGLLTEIKAFIQYPSPEAFYLQNKQNLCHLLFDKSFRTVFSETWKGEIIWFVITLQVDNTYT